MENRINIGELDTKVTIKQVTQTIGTQGQKTWTSSVHSNVFAKVERNVDEAVGDYNLESGNTIRLTVYKIAALTTRWQVVIGSVTYGITSIDPISRVSPLCVLTLQAIE